MRTANDLRTGDVIEIMEGGAWSTYIVIRESEDSVFINDAAITEISRKDINNKPKKYRIQN